jgi:hypothetical protein
LLAVDVDVAGFPLAPVTGGLLSDRRIRGMEEPGVGVDDATVTVFLG